MKKIKLPIQKEDITDKIDAGKDTAIKVKEQAHNLAEFAKGKADDAREDYLRAKYRPVFKENLEEIREEMPELIRVIDDEDDMRKIEEFKDAIGFKKKINGMNVLGLYPEYMEIVGVDYYPHDAEPLYYRDPYKNRDYIGLSDFYNHLKEARVNELKLVAQQLGATHIKIEYKEEVESVFSRDAKAKLKGKVGKKAAEIDGEHHKKTDEFSSTEILAETNLVPSDKPTVPKLTYLAGSKSVETLIEMRTNPGDGGKVENDTYKIRCKSLKGISEKDAVKIDGVLKQFKIGGNVSVASMVERQNREMFEYTIKF